MHPPNSYLHHQVGQQPQPQNSQNQQQSNNPLLHFHQISLNNTINNNESNNKQQNQEGQKANNPSSEFKSWQKFNNLKTTESPKNYLPTSDNDEGVICDNSNIIEEMIVKNTSLLDKHGVAHLQMNNNSNLGIIASNSNKGYINYNTNSNVNVSNISTNINITPKNMNAPLTIHNNMSLGGNGGSGSIQNTRQAHTSGVSNSRKLEELQKNLRKVYKIENMNVKNKKVNLKRLLKTHELNFSSPSKGNKQLSTSERHTRGCSSGNSQLGVNNSSMNQNNTINASEKNCGGGGSHLGANKEVTPRCVKDKYLSETH